MMHRLELFVDLEAVAPAVTSKMWVYPILITRLSAIADVDVSFLFAYLIAFFLGGGMDTAPAWSNNRGGSNIADSWQTPDWGNEPSSNRGARGGEYFEYFYQLTFLGGLNVGDTWAKPEYEGNANRVAIGRKYFFLLDL